MLWRSKTRNASGADVNHIERSNLKDFIFLEVNAMKSQFINNPAELAKVFAQSTKDQHKKYLG
jgi:hypothetical protein